MPRGVRRAGMRPGRNMRRTGSILALAAALGFMLHVPPGAAAAAGAATDCAPPLPLEKAVVMADLVFVGTVTATANNGRSATVDVTEIWRGDVPTPAAVNGGSDPTNPAEDDRVFSVGTTYLFLPVLTGGALVDGVCSSTVPWSDDLARLRPPQVGKPLAATPAGSSPLAFLGWLGGPLAMVGLIGGGAIALSLLIARRRDA